MNGHIVALLEKVCPATSNYFNDHFWAKLNIVTNALDNVEARLYIDSRCVSNGTPLVESGTLGPKGHV
jgi:ubiquitin-activating enzyme E1